VQYLVVGSLECIMYTKIWLLCYSRDIPHQRQLHLLMDDMLTRNEPTTKYLSVNSKRRKLQHAIAYKSAKNHAGTVY